MPSCTFFGHKEVSADIRPKLEAEICSLIETKQVSNFYVGNNGGFDQMVYSTLKKLKQQYPHISFSVVLAYFPTKKEEYSYYEENETMVPDGVENGPLRFAISRRNNWLIEQADYVITHVTHSWGGAAQFKEKAEKKNKIVINII